MLRRNDIFEMTCENFGQDAQGVCRHDGMAVFVPGLLPGERAMVRIVKPEKRYAFGRIEQLLQCAPERTEPFCPIYKRCGGCSCQHMTYETSLRFKQDQVQQLLTRVGGTLTGAEAVRKSFPDFFDRLRGLGIEVNEHAAGK